MFNPFQRAGINAMAYIFYLISFLLVFVQTAVPSPKASTDLICHTNHALECYPRTFQPTLNFQTVHDDQELPPGLHIRMNLATGVKEARLNEPEPEEEKQSTGLVIVDDDELQGPPGLQDQSKSQHFALPPLRPPPFDHSESSLFASSIDILKSPSLPDPDTTVSALSDLEDLAHSHHWGLTLARDPSLSYILFNYLLPSTSQSQYSIEIRSATAVLLATAIHNNPAALTAALSHFYNDEWPTGPLEAVLLGLTHEQLPSLLTRMVFLLSALCQDETQLWKFVDAGGLDLLAQVFDPEMAGSDGKDKLRGKIANFMLDHLFQIDERTTDRSSSADSSQYIKTELDVDLDLDSWVMINDNMLSSMEAAGCSDRGATNKPDCSESSATKPFHIGDVFKPWCSLLEKSSRRLSDKGGNNSETVRAYENIQDAQHALEVKMSAYGCGCLRDCGSKLS